MIIDCLSDLHGHYPELEGGDLLLLAGDYTATGKLTEWAKFFSWLKKQNYKKKILVAGNHDNFLEMTYPKTREELERFEEVQDFLTMMGEDIEDFEYLCDSGTEFEGLKVWGSPWTAQFKGINPKTCAFTVREFDHTDEILDEYWKKIPDDTDILITHCPPYGIFDSAMKDGKIIYTGSMNLRRHVMDRIIVPLHVFGHIHEHGGKMMDCISTKFVNASLLDKNYKPTNKPVRIVL